MKNLPTDELFNDLGVHWIFSCKTSVEFCYLYDENFINLRIFVLSILLKLSSNLLSFN